MEFLAPCKEMLNELAPYWGHELRDLSKLEPGSPCTFADESMIRLFFSLRSKNESLIWLELWRIWKLMEAGTQNVFVHPHAADLWTDHEWPVSAVGTLGPLADLRRTFAPAAEDSGAKWIDRHHLILFDCLGVRGGQHFLNDKPDAVFFMRGCDRKRSAHVDLVLKPYLVSCCVLLPEWKNEDLLTNRITLNAALGLGLRSTMELPEGLVILFQTPILDVIKDCKVWERLAPAPEPLETMPEIECSSSACCTLVVLKDMKNLSS